MLGREYIIRAISEIDGERMIIDEGRPVQTIDFVTTELILVEIAVRDDRRVDRFLLHEQTSELMRRFDDLDGTYTYRSNTFKGTLLRPPIMHQNLARNWFAYHM